MKFRFDKSQCQNIRKALRKEWIITNGLGAYASSTILACNTRKYHGLFNVNCAEPAGRFVLLSTLEESICAGGKEFLFSCRQHPKVYYPNGHEYLDNVDISDWPTFEYTIGPLTLRREIIMPYKRNITLLRYTAFSDIECPPLTLKVKPLLAFRDMHTLTFQNNAIDAHIDRIAKGFEMKPYSDLPKISMFVESDKGANFIHSPEWCKQVQYFIEEERGFPFEEDLFKIGSFEISIEAGKSVYIAVTTEKVEEKLIDLWTTEGKRRHKINEDSSTVLEHLRNRSENFISESPQKLLEVIAGYPWFQAWGRDTLIALPGITFAAGRIEAGKNILQNMVKYMKNGLIPNMFSPDGNNSYNTIDSSMWFVQAVQSLDKYGTKKDDKEKFIREICYPAINNIITSYYNHVAYMLPNVYVNSDGLLHVGDANTQLTWMDAHAYNKPVTPRYGYAVEINALWYNAIEYSLELAKRFGEEPLALCKNIDLKNMRTAFRNMFWVNQQCGYLADSYSNDGLMSSIRPNQIFAVSAQYSILDENDQACVVETVRNHLLTPYGLRTLSPRSSEYKGRYEGNGDERDSAYHQGTVWPWLLGAYGDALLRTAWDKDGAVFGLLGTLTPLFSTHLADAGLGSISEIFGGDPPFLPDGCISQAWSVSEPYRLLCNLKEASPDIYNEWEKRINVMFS